VHLESGVEQVCKLSWPPAQCYAKPCDVATHTGAVSAILRPGVSNDLPALAGTPADVNCSDINQRSLVVRSPDPYRLDRDHDCLGCES
jgi:hypothetical protein